MKQKYNTPKITIIVINDNDIISTSFTAKGEDIHWASKERNVENNNPIWEE